MRIILLILALMREKREEKSLLWEPLRKLRSPVISGQLATVGHVVADLNMPVLAAFLFDKGDDLQGLAVDTIFRAGATRALAAAVSATGAQVGDLGANEMAEGLTRLAVSDAMALRSAELAEAGDELTAAGLVEMAAASGMREAAEDLAAEGVAEMVTGAAELGAAATMGDVADALEDASDEEA